jgi:hypothetical protein
MLFGKYIALLPGVLGIENGEKVLEKVIENIR